MCFVLFSDGEADTGLSYTGKKKKSRVLLILTHNVELILGEMLRAIQTYCTSPSPQLDMSHHMSIFIMNDLSMHTMIFILLYYSRWTKSSPALLLFSF